MKHELNYNSNTNWVSFTSDDPADCEKFAAALDEAGIKHEPVASSDGRHRMRALMDRRGFDPVHAVHKSVFG